jgi:1-deoxy-D-xylulose-5-phosphate synthase
VWDLSILGVVPGIRVAAPRDGSALVEQFGEALMTEDGPTALRFPKGTVGADVEAVERIDGLDVLYGEPDVAHVLLVTVGPLAAAALDAAARLGKCGVDAAVVDPRWVLPVPKQLSKLACAVRLVVTIEESGLHGGFGSALAALFREEGVDTPVRNIGVPQRFLSHGTREEIHTALGFNGEHLAERIMSWVGGCQVVGVRSHDDRLGRGA